MGKLAAIQSDPLPDLIDQFAPLRLQVEANRPVENQAERLWQKIKPFLEKYPGDKPVILKGRKYQLHVTECGMKRHVLPAAIEKLKKVFGFKRFSEIVANAFPVGPIDAMLTSEQQAGMVVERQDGNRRIAQVVEIDGPAQAKAA